MFKNQPKSLILQFCQRTGKMGLFAVVFKHCFEVPRDVATKEFVHPQL